MKWLENTVKALNNMAGQTGLKIKAASPEILMVVGIAGVIGTTVLASMATLKVEAVLEEHKEVMDKVHEAWDRVQAGEISTETYSEMDKKKDTIIQYMKTTGEFLKLYGPAVALGGFSIFCLISSHGIMKKRNVALMAAYQALDKGFNAYRQRVIEDFGEERDYMYKNGLQEETIVETETDENGKTKKVKKTKLAVRDPNQASVYARFFDETNPNWAKDPQFNFYFLKTKQNYLNNLLQAKGYLFLSEVYEELGFEASQASRVVGWMIGSETGDGFIDFGIFNGDNPKARDFVNGYEKSILLDFNVDGLIYNLFTKKKV